MISRQFTAREKILILVLALLMLAALYVKVVYMDVSSVMAQYPLNMAEAEEEYAVEKQKNDVLKIMQRELEQIALGSKEVKEIPAYDNSKNIINELNQILLTTDDFTLTFLPLEEDATMVRRKIVLSFAVSSYSEAKKVVAAIDDMQYRCLVTSMVFTSKETVKTSGVQGSLEATFLETKITKESAALVTTPVTEESE